MGPVYGAKSVVHVNFAQFSQLGGKALVVGLLLTIKTQIFQQQNLARLHGCGHFLRLEIGRAHV